MKFGKAAFDNVMYDFSLYNLMKENFSEFCETIAKNLGSEKMKETGGSCIFKDKNENNCEFSLTSKIFNSDVKYEYNPIAEERED